MGGGKNRHRKKNSKKGGGGVSIFLLSCQVFKSAAHQRKWKPNYFDKEIIVQKIRQKSVILQVCVSGSKKVLAHLQVPLYSNLCGKLTKTCHWVKIFLNPEA